MTLRSFTIIMGGVTIGTAISAGIHNVEIKELSSRIAKLERPISAASGNVSITPADSAPLILGRNVWELRNGTIEEVTFITTRGTDSILKSH